MTIACETQTWSYESSASNITVCVEGSHSYGANQIDYNISVTNEAESGSGLHLYPLIQIYRNGTEAQRHCFDVMPGESKNSIMSVTLDDGQNDINIAAAYEQPECSGDLFSVETPVEINLQTNPIYKGIIGDMGEASSPPQEGGYETLVLVGVILIAAFLVYRHHST